MITASLDTPQIGPQAGSQIGPQIGSQIGSQVASQNVDTAWTAPGKVSNGLAQDNAFRAAYAASLGEKTAPAKSVTEDASKSGGIPHPEDGGGLLQLATGTGTPLQKQTRTTIQPQSEKLSGAGDPAVKSKSSGVASLRGFAVAVAGKREGSVFGAESLTSGTVTLLSESATAKDATDKAVGTTQIAAGISGASAALKSASGQIASAVQVAPASAAQAAIQTSGLLSGKAKQPDHAGGTTPVGSRKGDVSGPSGPSPIDKAVQAQSPASSQIAQAVEPSLPKVAAAAQLPVLAAGEPPVLPTLQTALNGTADNTLDSGLVAEHPGIQATDLVTHPALLASQSANEVANGTEFALPGAIGSIANGTVIEKTAGDRSVESTFVGLTTDLVTSKIQQTTQGAADARPLTGGAVKSGTDAPGGVPTGLPNDGPSSRRDRSVGISGLVGTRTPGELEGSIRQPVSLPSRLAPSGSVSTASQAATVNGTRDTLAARPAKAGAAGAQEGSSRTHAIEGFDSSGPGLSGELRTLAAAGQSATPDLTKIANDASSTTPHSADPAVKSPEPANPAAREAQAEASGEVRDRAAKLFGGDRESITAASAASGKDAASAAATPSNLLLDGAIAPGAASVITAAAAVAHASVEAASSLAHSGGSSAITGASATAQYQASASQAGAIPPGSAADRQFDRGVDGALSAQPSATRHGVESQRILLATPTALEVGVQSGTQGWLKIRAEVGGQGEVRASLDAVSNAGRDLLHSQLPALNAFLHGEQVQVTATLTERSAISEFGTGASAAGTEAGGSHSGASNGSLPQGNGGHTREGTASATTEGAARYNAGYDSLAVVSDAGGLGSGLQSGASPESGRWLNVRV